MCPSNFPYGDGDAAAVPPKFANVSIVCRGTRGDAQPYAAVGLALVEAGYRVRILTHEDHKPFVESFGLTHVHVFHNFEESLKNDPRFRKSMAEGEASVFFRALNDDTREHAGPSFDKFHREMEAHRPDLLVVGTLCGYFEQYANIALGIPTVRVQPNAWSRERRAPLGIPTLPFGLHNYFLLTVWPRSMVKSWEHFDDVAETLSPGVRVMSMIDAERLLEEFHTPRLPCLITKSPMFGAVLNPSINVSYKFVGAVIIEKKHELRHSGSFGGEDDVFDALEEFLSRDPDRKPVYMGWGSMMCKSPPHMALLAVEALRLSDRRGIVLGGWADLSMEVLENATTDDALLRYARENVLFVKKAPHEWLLPRVAAAVHHGGAGTTNASVRAGVPTIVTPVVADQFDQAYLVEELGVGIGFSRQFRKISAGELADAIAKVTAPGSSYRVAAEAAGGKLREERGAKRVVEELEKFWEESVVTGGWKDVVKNRLKSNRPRRAGITGIGLWRLAGAGLVGAAAVAIVLYRPQQ